MQHNSLQLAVDGWQLSAIGKAGAVGWVGLGRVPWVVQAGATRTADGWRLTADGWRLTADGGWIAGAGGAIKIRLQLCMDASGGQTG